MFAALASLVIFCTPASSGDVPRSAGDAPASPPSSSTSPDIIVKHTIEARVVYREHVGPYWTVGPVFAEVQAYMLEQGRHGPMYIRYLDSPSIAAADKLRAEIGFFVNGDHRPKPPYQFALRGSEVVAAMSVVGRDAVPPRYTTILRRWATAHEHTPLGPVTEIFAPARGSGATDRAIEVQMAIRPMTSKRGPTADQIRGRSAQDRAAIPTRPKAAHAATSSERLGSPGGTGSAEFGQVAGVGSQTRSDAAASVHELAHLQRFDEIAGLLMPPGIPFPPSFQLWFGQVVLRLGGVAGGIAEVYPGEESAVPALSEAIRRRYDVVSVDFTLDPRDQPVLRVEPRADGSATRQRAIMRELDAILGNIALMRLDADAVDGKVIDIVQSVYDLLSTESSVGSKHGP